MTRGERISTPDPQNPKLTRPGMAFTTIETVYENVYALRGCIGFLTPVKTLLDAVIDSAIEAAAHDPRFMPVTPGELDHIVVEVTILSEPVLVNVPNRKSIPNMVKIGVHGVLVERGWFRGTLLPVVPVEYCWDQELFLEETCIKAGLPSQCWKSEATRIYLYEGRAFKEVSPRGEIVERDLQREYSERCGK